MLARTVYVLIVAALAALATATRSDAMESNCPAILDQKFSNLMDEPVSLCQFSGKVVLIVNTASECGYTPQYDGLEKLYRRYRDKGFVVLGFPANDFGAQEPGSNKEIAQFCQVNYGITFPVFAKTSVVGAKSKPALSRPRRQDRQTTALELSQVSAQQSGPAGSRVRKRRRTRRYADYRRRSRNCSPALTLARFKSSRFKDSTFGEPTSRFNAFQLFQTLRARNAASRVRGACSCSCRFSGHVHGHDHDDTASLG